MKPKKQVKRLRKDVRELKNALKPKPEPAWDGWERAAWAPPVEMTIDQWAEENVILPRSVSAEPGPVNLNRTPYLREILRAMTDPQVEEVTLCFSTQVGKTTACILPVLYYLDQDPWPCLHVMPREEDAVSVNVDRYQKIIQASPSLERHLTGAANDMTREAIRLNGTALTFVGANSPAALASRAICVLVLDETDKYPPFSGQEADPIALARERTRTFGNRKIIKVSTPTTERGYIWREYQQSDRRRYLVPCPHCGYRQQLVMGSGADDSPGIHLPPGERDPERIVDLRLAWYECESCHRRIGDTTKPIMLRRGVWCPHGCEVSDDGAIRGQAPPRRLSGYHLSALYSPWLTWSEIVAEFLRSKPVTGKLMNFRNSWQAEIWEDKVDEVTAQHVRARVGGYEMGTVPIEAHCMTAGVDVQLDHLWYVIRAWGAHGESWLIREGRVEGWEALNRVLFQALYMAGADPVPVKCVLIDMGYRTDEVFAFSRKTGCQPVKGAANPSRSFTVSKHQHADGSASPLVMIDTGYYKAKLHRLIRMRDEDPGSWHLPGVVDANGITTGGVDEEYYSHIVSEQRVRDQEKKTGRVHFPWKRVPAGAANHLLDCFDDQTDVLTAAGWKRFEAVAPDDEVATLNREDGHIEFQKPTARIAREHNGEMIQIGGSRGHRVNLCVTPEHRMLVKEKRWDPRAKRWSWPVAIKLAKDLTKWDSIALCGKWRGMAVATVKLPAIGKYPEVEIDGRTLAEFLGWYIAEGYCLSVRSIRRVVLYQSKAEGRNAIRGLLRRLPWTFQENKRGFVLTNQQAFELVRDVGPQTVRRVPAWIKSSSPEIIRAFVDAAVMGDGWHQRGSQSYATISPGLADDMQELYLKLGYCSSMAVRPPAPYCIRGRRGDNTRPQYHVHRKSRQWASLRSGDNKPNFSRLQYDGMIYCATVPNGTLVVRRGGKVAIAGNCEVYALAAAEILDVEHVYTAPPARSETEADPVLVNQAPRAANLPPKRRRFQQIKSRFFS